MIFPLVNGNYFSFQDVTLRINGLAFLGFKSLNYKDNLGREYVRGAARVPLGITAGRYEASLDFELFLPQANFLLTTLGPGWRGLPNLVSVSYAPGLASLASAVSFLAATTDIIPGVYFTELDASNSEGEGGLTRKFSGKIPGQILWNGVPSLIETNTIGAVG